MLKFFFIISFISDSDTSISIPVSVYERLIQDSVNVHKSQVKIENLKENLDKQLEENNQLKLELTQKLKENKELKSKLESSQKHNKNRNAEVSKVKQAK